MGKMAMRHFIIAALVFFFVDLSLLKGDDSGSGLGASFIFGDSLVDAGNNNYLQTLSRANIVPNGIDFQASGGTPTGRYTNGRTIGDIIGKLISSLREMHTKTETILEINSTAYFRRTLSHNYLRHLFMAFLVFLCQERNWDSHTSQCHFWPRIPLDKPYYME